MENSVKMYLLTYILVGIAVLAGRGLLLGGKFSRGLGRAGTRASFSAGACRKFVGLSSLHSIGGG